MTISKAVVRDERVHFVHALRGVACLLVVYCHLIGNHAMPDWAVKPLVKQFLIVPLGIIWNFGYLGVAIFFVISGFIITHVAQRESRHEFLIKRLFRIFPPLFGAIAVAFVLAHYTNHPAAHLSPSDLLREASLFASDFKVIGPSYTLLIEVMFYLLAASILPLLRRTPILSVAIITSAPIVVWGGLQALSSGVETYGSGFAKKLAYFHFLPVFAMGMAIYYAWLGRIGSGAATGLVVCCWLVLVWVTNGPANSNAVGFQLNTVYAVIIFCGALWARMDAGRIPGLKGTATVSYSLYLLHVPIGTSVFYFLKPMFGYSAALPVALVLTGFSAWTFYIYLERPSQKLAKRCLASHWWPNRYARRNQAAPAVPE